VEHGPLSGGRAEQDMWSHSGRDTKEEALKHIEQLLRLGCTVYAFRDPADTLITDERQITERFGPPISN
jgi:hypothetical protein